MNIHSRRRPGLLHLITLLVFALGAGTSGSAEIPVYSYKVIEKIAQPRENFVQGLQIVGDTLYIGTGMYGASKLREYAFPSMRLRQETQLPDELFGEGVTRLGDSLYQLTWRAGLLLEYNAASLTLVRRQAIATQGWGITHNGSELIYSDGSHQLYFLDPDTLSRQRTLEVTLNGRPLPRLNELEWIEGEIWANVWQANQLVRIDPDSGMVLAIVDLRGLLNPTERQPDTDVLNGIAWDSAKRALWVTGKRWPWLFHIELSQAPPREQKPPAQAKGR
jgi:glutamine cyclotransferase